MGKSRSSDCLQQWPDQPDLKPHTHKIHSLNEGRKQVQQVMPCCLVRTASRWKHALLWNHWFKHHQATWSGWRVFQLATAAWNQPGCLDRWKRLVLGREKGSWLRGLRQGTFICTAALNVPIKGKVHTDFVVYSDFRARQKFQFQVHLEAIVQAAAYLLEPSFVEPIVYPDARLGFQMILRLEISERKWYPCWDVFS